MNRSLLFQSLLIPAILLLGTRMTAAAPPSDRDRFVRVRDGDFELGGETWVPYGINFWPRYAISTGVVRDWLGPDLYDSAQVQADLERVRDFGMNVVCVQYKRENEARALIDFLERCRALDLRAFIYLNGGFALRPNPDQLQSLIRAARLAGSDAVFAYDVAWEPHVGDEDQRTRFDPLWRDWIIERYGNIESAERDWAAAAPRNAAGAITGPSNKQILNDGPHRVMVAAYRRFLDDAISQGYGVVRRAIREFDPNHLIGVRTGYGGSGFPGIDHRMPFDLASGARHLDFLSPEGYSYGPEWDSVRRAGLTTAYARLVGAGKPVWWAEYGATVHPPSPERLERQATMYRNFARLFIESRANGGAGWWLPGGFREGEKSDYGIFNPDGTPRPAAYVIREWAPRVAAIRAPTRAADATIFVDRDLHPRGYSAIRARHADDYASAVAAGRSVALATSGTGTTSADTPLIAVGNRPCNGANPPKFLNAEFERFWIMIDDGPWREVRNGERLIVMPNLGVFGRAMVANTAEARWLAPAPSRSAAGTVRLVTTRASTVQTSAPLAADTEFLRAGEFKLFEISRDIRKDTSVEFELEAAGRARFGRHFKIHFEVAHPKS